MPAHGGLKSNDPADQNYDYEPGGSGGSNTGSGGSVWADILGGLFSAAGTTYASIYAADQAADVAERQSNNWLAERMAAINARGKWILPVSGIALVIIVVLIIIIIRRRRK